MGLTIEEAAAATGVSRHTLRYYERIGLLEPVARGANGHRRYTDADLGWVQFLTLLRSTGMPIADMLRFVEMTRGGDGTIRDRVELLEHHREELRARLEMLTRNLAAIDTKVSIYRGILADQEAAAPAPPVGTLAAAAS